MAFWPFRAHERLNTINLYGDLDDVELVEDIEKQFGICISNGEAEQTLTMGQLEELVQNHLGERADETIWEHLCRIARFHSGHEGPIDRDTTFFASHAKERIRNG
jgi:hypothetical protein